MGKFQVTMLLAVAAVIFTVIAALTMNRVVVATLFLALLAFIAVSEGALRRSRRGMADLVEAGMVETKKTEEALAEQAATVEAFAYATTQDPGSPLREIDETGRALQENYAHTLDTKGKEHLRRIQAASQRMAQLFDDLANLSRLSRQVMQCESVDLSATARAIAAELQESQPERQAEFVIENGLVADGDAAMLKDMLENLLVNSWKSTVRQARIEFSSKRDGGRPVYCLRYNGAGFNHEGIRLLFASFQPWSKVSEFPVSGVGLANVQQIIRRHGGSVWAEAGVGEEATIFFTLKP